MLSRLTNALGRLMAMTTPRCPECRIAMQERPDAPDTPSSPVYEVVYECPGCRRRVAHRVAWEIPD